MVESIDMTSPEETPWWFPLLLMSIGICVGECVWQGVLKVSLKSWSGAVSATRRKVWVPRQARKASRVRRKASPPRQARKVLRVKTLGILDEPNRRDALTESAFAMSPIQEVGGQLPRKTHITAEKHWTATAMASPVPKLVQQKAYTDLALSGIVLTVDIPPLLPGQIDDEAINRLAEMLKRW